MDGWLAIEINAGPSAASSVRSGRLALDFFRVDVLHFGLGCRRVLPGRGSCSIRRFIGIRLAGRLV